MNWHIVYVILWDIQMNFMKFFDNLLSKAANMGVYNPSLPILEDYCEY